MKRIGRRGFLGASAAAVSAGGLAPQVKAQTVSPASPPEVTRILARYIVGGKLADIPAPVRKEAARTLLNWTGCALGGSHTDAVGMAIAALSPLFGPAHATLLGRKERADMMHAALINGIASHVMDYDDTHLRTVIHPAGPVVSAILALAETR